MIPKVENTSKHKYDQSNAINNTARAISSTTQSKQYDQQYSQSNQSDMTGNTIRTNPRLVTVTLLVALMQKPETRTNLDV